MLLVKSGESHGKVMTGILTDVPAGIPISEKEINIFLRERNSAFGRSERQRKEKDKLFLLSGVYNNQTIGNNVALIIKNSVRTGFTAQQTNGAFLDSTDDMPPLTNFRPGHADMAGTLKYRFDNARFISEGASARNTCLDVAAGAIAISFLNQLGIEITAFVRSIGTYTDTKEYSFENLSKVKTPFYTPNKTNIANFKAEVCDAEKNGDTLGGKVEIRVTKIKNGFGGYIAQKRVNALIAQHIMQIQAVKGVLFGNDILNHLTLGTNYADQIIYTPDGYKTTTLNSGGIDGGMTNGGELKILAEIKPLPTTKKGVISVDVNGKQCVSAKERSDITAVFALCPILKSTVALALSQAICDRLGYDNLTDIKNRYNAL